MPRKKKSTAKAGRSAVETEDAGKSPVKNAASNDASEPDTAEPAAPAAEESAAGKDGSFVVMLDDDSGSASDSGQAADDGSFVVMLDEEPATSAAATASPGDGSFVVLLDDEEDDPDCVQALSDGVFGITLPADVRIQKVMTLKPELVATLGASKVQYDATRVALVDTASIQVVAAHLVALDAGDTCVEWVGASDEFLETAQLLGFDFCQSETAADEQAPQAA